MTEKILPVPPVPPHASGENFPSHGPDGIPGNKPPQGPPPPYWTHQQGPGLAPQLHPQQGYAAYPPQQYAQPQFGYPAPPAKPPSSGLRVTAGILMIVLGFWLFLSSALSFGHYVNYEYAPYGIAGLLFGIVSLGSTSTGIIVLAKHRSRTRPAPLAAIIFAALAFIISLWTTAAESGNTLGFICLFVSAPAALIMLGLVLLKEKRTA